MESHVVLFSLSYNHCTREGTTMPVFISLVGGGGSPSGSSFQMTRWQVKNDAFPPLNVGGHVVRV